MQFTKWEQGTFLRDGEGGVCRSLVLQWFGNGCVPLTTGRRGETLFNQARAVQNAPKKPGWFASQLQDYNLRMYSSETDGDAIGSFSGFKDCDFVENFCKTVPAMYLIGFSPNDEDAELYGDVGHAIGFRSTAPMKGFDPNLGFWTVENDKDSEEWFAKMMVEYAFSYSEIQVFRLQTIPLGVVGPTMVAARAFASLGSRANRGSGK